MYKVQEAWNNLMAGVPNIVGALIILVLAYACALLVKGLVYNVISFLRVDKALDKAGLDNEKKNSIKDFVAKLSFLITFILFIPGIFEKIGLSSVASPIVSMIDKFLSYLPNITAAIVLLVIGLLVAKIVRELLIPVFDKLNIDVCLKKIGFESNSKSSLSEILANVIYVIILIPIVIASLDALKINAISTPAVQMLNSILLFLPKVVIAIAMIFVGRFVAKLASGLLNNVLVSIGTDKVADNIFKVSGTKTDKDFSLSKIIAGFVNCLIIIFFLVEALNLLKLQVLSNIGNSIIAYMPYAISSIIILGVAILIANYIETAITTKFPDSKVLAIVLKVIVITIGVFITLYQLGVAKALVNSAFIIVLGAFAVAFAIAFGFGGRDFASHMLAKLEKKIDNSAKPVKAVKTSKTVKETKKKTK